MVKEYMTRGQRDDREQSTPNIADLEGGRLLRLTPGGADGSENDRLSYCIHKAGKGLGVTGSEDSGEPEAFKGVHEDSKNRDPEVAGNGTRERS